MRTKIIASIIVLITVGVSVSFILPGSSSAPTQTKYILVKSAFMMPSDILKPNAALLIEDKGEIQKNESLFLGNQSRGHACGYHYAIQFWDDSLNLVDGFSFNEECEEFMKHDRSIQSKMKGYIKQLESQPTHYIYNLEIPVSISPTEVTRYFADAELPIFFLEGKSKHYSTITFTYLQVAPIVELEDRSKWTEEQNENQEKAVQKIKAIVDQIDQLEDIKAQSKISFPLQSFGGGEIEHLGEITLKFDYGTDFYKIKEIIKANDAKVDRVFEPETYFIQLVDKSDDLQKVKTKMTAFDKIVNVFEYPKTR